MPLKPVKRGIKVWALADASNGYITNFQVYTGKQGDVEKGEDLDRAVHQLLPSRLF